MTDLQQKILLLTKDGYVAKEIGNKLHVTVMQVNKHLYLLRAEFKAKTTTELIATLYCKGIMQEIEKEYL